LGALLFSFYNSEKNDFGFLMNDAAQSQGGAGIKAAQTVSDIGPDILIVPRIGENAAQVLNPLNIKIYKAAPGR
jgi:predicted Fe-Mo cluster-binding NifX family protein